MWRILSKRSLADPYQDGATRPEATTPEDIVKRTELHQRYVEPTKMVLGQSKHGLLGKSGVHQFFP